MQFGIEAAWSFQPIDLILAGSKGVDNEAKRFMGGDVVGVFFSAFERMSEGEPECE
jgi:hypothetical protein